MRDSDYHRMCRIRAQRELTAEEQSRVERMFREQPELREDWELEQVLEAAWSADPAPRVASNFTERVLESLETPEREPRGISCGSILDGWRRRWVRPLVAMVVLGACVFAGWEYYQNERDFRLRSLAAVSGVVEFPDVKVLQDLEIIERLAAIPVEPDTDLLLALE